MTIKEIKTGLGLEKLELEYSINSDGSQNKEWLRNWNSLTRVQISIHIDTMKASAALT